MRFVLDAGQRAFADSLDAMLTAAGTPSVVREWSRGEHGSGRALWSRIAEAGVFALTVPEEYGGLGAGPVELVVAFVELGRHAVPGPLVETVAATALLLGLDDPGPAERLLPTLASGESTATLVPQQATFAPSRRPARSPTASRAWDVPPVAAPAESPGTSSTRTSHRPAESTHRTPLLEGQTLPAGARAPGPYALDADMADVRLTTPEPLTAPPGTTDLYLAPAVRAAEVHRSLDPARRLFRLPPGGELLASGPQVAGAAAHALATGRLATAAQALGVGLTLLDRTVVHVGQRSQFGVPVGSFQAVKHRLADAKIALEFARAVLFGAALTMAAADVAAAKVTACEAAYTTARTALQLHGAIGYTAEYDLSLWLTKARALRTAWGGPRECRALVLSGGDRRW
ncbi:acyl-CoA dehydrogenase family protein [Streptomyces sp. NBC_00847]|uniref:acyl-CoA dehydrogenase family protein n=1 Tax=Streptomyces sp. NBC_00847 TaxID=2975850 RepID=UPI002253913F|nr:acyl-CoA dehydrogenase family protein [Streptomyces sp. NBC_00847]MCX4880109.1 acyl-CoA/acyl-ACP dehydrogenase [Streptomyces sp. NBC_00847]